MSSRHFSGRFEPGQRRSTHHVRWFLIVLTAGATPMAASAAPPRAPTPATTAKRLDLKALNPSATIKVKQPSEPKLIPADLSQTAHAPPAPRYDTTRVARDLVIDPSQVVKTAAIEVGGRETPLSSGARVSTSAYGPHLVTDDYCGFAPPSPTAPAVGLAIKVRGVQPLRFVSLHCTVSVARNKSLFVETGGGGQWTDMTIPARAQGDDLIGDVSFVSVARTSAHAGEVSFFLRSDGAFIYRDGGCAITESTE